VSERGGEEKERTWVRDYERKRLRERERDGKSIVKKKRGEQRVEGLTAKAF